MLLFLLSNYRLTSIAGLVHVNDLDLTTQILVSPCHTCSVCAIKKFQFPHKILRHLWIFLWVLKVFFVNQKGWGHLHGRALQCLLNWNFPDYIRKWLECYGNAFKVVLEGYRWCPGSHSHVNFQTKAGDSIFWPWKNGFLLHSSHFQILSGKFQNDLKTGFSYFLN